jgi:hypothetical protein
MKPKLFVERGQALILIALAAVGLFGVTGLAIDGSARFSDRRHAQNAADAAALSGALAYGNLTADPVYDADGNLTSPIDWKINAKNIADDNGYDGDHVRSEVQVYLCSEHDATCGAGYAGSTQYVQVIITSHVKTYFARVLGIFETQNVVQAIALAKRGGPLYEGNSIVALNPHSSCPGSLRVGGSGTITLDGGGILVNSDSADCAFEQQGCSMNLEFINGGGITSSGTDNVDFDACYSGSPSTPSYGAGQIVFPTDLEIPDEPAECDVSTPGWFNSDATTTYLHPGRWNEFPPKSGGGITVRDHMYMYPGIYCVNNVVKLTDQHLILTSDSTDGVTIYIRPGYDFSIQNGEFHLFASKSGEYQGYLIIVASNFSGSPDTCVIDGNSHDEYTGTIYAPYCNLTINGTADATAYNGQIIAYEVKLNGSSSMSFNYDSDANGHTKRKVGLMK